MPRQIFVNLPVKDLQKSIDFYDAIGFKLNPQFTDETAACMVLSEEIYVMLLTHPKFKEFTPKSIVDSKSSTEVINCLSCESKAEVDGIAGKATAAGGTQQAEPKDHGFMYQHGFEDLDGHIWELVWMDAAAMAG